jgi:hypothetical protein
MLRTASLLLAGVVAASTVGVTTIGATTTEASAHAAAAGSASVRLQAVPADSVVDSYGVGIHTNFLNTPYRDYRAVGDALADLGVRHVRDDLYLDAPRQYAAIRSIAERAGVGFDLICGRPGGDATPADYVDTVADQLAGGEVESLEGVNEWDLFGGGDSWPTELADWQRQLHDAMQADPATADLPLLAPALAFRWNYAQLGDLSSWVDVANAHMYPGGYKPFDEIGAITRAVRDKLPLPPLVTTEAGYHNALAAGSSHPGVPEDVAGSYLPRMLLEHVVRGEKRMYSYELIDEFDDPEGTNAEAHFGLLRHDLSPKPAYTAMKNLLGLLADPGPDFTPDSLDITASGLPSDVRYLLTQKRDGRFVLLLWRDVSIYDPIAQQHLAVEPADATLKLADPVRWQVYRPSEGAEPVRTATASSLPVSLDGDVTAIAIDPAQPPTKPRKVKAKAKGKAGAGKVIVRWRPPAQGGPITAYRLTVAGRTLVTGPDERKAVVKRLAPGSRVRVKVAARNEAGWSTAARSRYVKVR